MPNYASAKPILSICIPTLNRDSLLEVILANLEREAPAYLDRIEIVVADNASSTLGHAGPRKSDIARVNCYSSGRSILAINWP